MPSSGDNLSLGALGKAVGANGSISGETALAADGRGSTGTETTLSHFYISSVNSTVSGVDTTPDESDTDAVTLGFAGDAPFRLRRLDESAFELGEGKGFEPPSQRKKRKVPM